MFARTSEFFARLFAALVALAFLVKAFFVREVTLIVNAWKHPTFPRTFFKVLFAFDAVLLILVAILVGPMAALACLAKGLLEGLAGYVILRVITSAPVVAFALRVKANFQARVAAYRAAKAAAKFVGPLPADMDAAAAV